MHEENPGIFCVQLIIAADYIQLDTLRKDVLRALVRYVDGKMLLCSSNAKENKHKVEELRLGELCEAIRTAYADDHDCLDPVRSSFVSLFWMAGNKLIRNAETLTLLDECRAFNHDLIATLAAAKCSMPNPWLPIPPDGWCLGLLTHVGISSRNVTRQSFNEGIPDNTNVVCHGVRCDSRLDADDDLIFYDSVNVGSRSHSNWCKKCAMNIIEENKFPWRV